MKWLLAILAILGLDYFMSQKSGKSMLGGLNPLTPKSGDSSGGVSGVINVITSQFEGTIPASRQNQLKIISKNIHDALKGAKIPDKALFIEQMIKINSDLEYQFVQSYFPRIAKGVSIEKFIGRQILIGKKVLEQINFEYERKGMLTRV